MNYRKNERWHLKMVDQHYTMAESYRNHAIGRKNEQWHLKMADQHYKMAESYRNHAFEEDENRIDEYPLWSRFIFGALGLFALGLFALCWIIFFTYVFWVNIAEMNSGEIALSMIHTYVMVVPLIYCIYGIVKKP